MCAKVEVIWRWSKIWPHSGGAIWSNLSQFLKKCDFSHHLHIRQTFFQMVTHMCQTCLWKKFLKKILWQCPLEAHTDVFSSQSRGHYKFKKIQKKQKLGNLVLFVDEIICAKFEVIWRWSKKCPHSGGTIWRRGVVYIECAKTPASPRYKGFNVR